MNEDRLPQLYVLMGSCGMVLLGFFIVHFIKKIRK